MTVGGSIGGLGFNGTIRISPPTQHIISADVNMSVTGKVSIDKDGHPWEAYKPFMFSSMHAFADLWDSQLGYIDSDVISIPVQGWFVNQPRAGKKLGLIGGDSQWKCKAPTVEVELIQPSSLQMTGWITDKYNPNDDNVAFWAFSDQIVSLVEYKITSKENYSSGCTKGLKSDFDGDGKTDILWLWQDTTNGDYAMWLMDGTKIVSGDGYVARSIPRNWQVIRLGDYNGDGKTDIPWQNADIGAIYIYFMDGIKVSNGGYVVNGMPNDWEIR